LLKIKSVKKSKVYGLIGSTLSTTILLLVMWFVVLSVPGSTESEGFLISLGDNEDAGGSGYAPSGKTSGLISTEAPTRKSTKTYDAPTPTVKQTIFTQTENSVTTDQQNEKAKERKIQNELNVQKADADKRKADQNRKEQSAINKASAVNGLFGGNNGTSGGGKGTGNGSGRGTGSGTGTGKGSGSGSGNGIQGNPAGRGTSGVGSTFRLGNRNYAGNPAKPNYPKDVEGKITVIIRVNENGSVTGTSIGSPTTISDSEMRRDAMSAANRTRFTPGKNVETGSITYNYKLE
jgi:TonB family protein